MYIHKKKGWSIWQEKMDELESEGDCLVAVTPLLHTSPPDDFHPANSSLPPPSFDQNNHTDRFCANTIDHFTGTTYTHRTFFFLEQNYVSGHCSHVHDFRRGQISRDHEREFPSVEVGPRPRPRTPKRSKVRCTIIVHLHKTALSVWKIRFPPPVLSDSWQWGILGETCCGVRSKRTKPRTVKPQCHYFETEMRHFSV